MLVYDTQLAARFDSCEMRKLGSQLAAIEMSIQFTLFLGRLPGPDRLVCRHSAMHYTNVLNGLGLAMENCVLNRRLCVA